MDKVLIVDDEHTLRETLSDILKVYGFHPLVACNGMDCMEVLKKESPHAILLDHKMPIMDGMTTLSEINKMGSDVPVILVTAYCDVSDTFEAVKLGAYDFLTKPPKVDRLIVTIKRAIEKLKLEREVKRLNEELSRYR